MGKYVVSLTGASGSVFAECLIQELLKQKHEVYLIASEQGEKVYTYELNKPYSKGIEQYYALAKENGSKFRVYDNNNLFAPIASGSVKMDATIVIPCSMGTLGKIANGIADNLITRTADVALKERRKLLLVVRETPLSSIHLKNMLEVSNAGGILMPPVPAFYAKPTSLIHSINLSVGRMLEVLGVSNSLHERWEGTYE